MLFIYLYFWGVLKNIKVQLNTFSLQRKSERDRDRERQRVKKEEREKNCIFKKYFHT